MRSALCLFLCAFLGVAACQTPRETPPPSATQASPAPASRPWAAAPRSWTWRNPSPQGLPLRAVWGSGPDNLFLAGAKGTLLHSNDGGLSWKTLSPPTERTLLGLWGEGERVFVVGAQGTLLQSNDRGNTWLSRRTHTTSDLLAIWGDSTGARYAAGTQGTLLRSLDEGETWTACQTGTSETLAALWGDASYLYAAGAHESLLQSQDQGQTWRAVPLSLPKSAPQAKPYTVAEGAPRKRPHEHDEGGVISFFGLAGGAPGEIFLAATGLALRVTRNARGEHQTEILSERSPHQGFAAVAGGDTPWFLAAQEITTPRDRAMATLGTLPENAQPVALWRSPDAALALVVGLNGSVARSTDGGRTWTSPPQLTRDDWNDLATNERALYALTADALFVSLDRGLSWIPRPLPPAPGAALRAGLSLCSTTSGALYVVGVRALLRTRDDGQHWEELSLPGDTADLRQLASDGHGLLFGLANGTRDAWWLSRDDGKSWTTQPAPPGANYRSAYVSPNGTLFLAGGRREPTPHGLIWTSRDHGKSWQEESFRAEVQDINGDRDEMFAVGRAGLLLSSQDDGQHWRESPSVTNDHFARVHACGEGRAVALGLYPGGFYTGNGGQDWEKLQGLPPRITRHATGTCDDLWLAGEAGTLLRGTTQTAAATR